MPYFYDVTFCDTYNNKYHVQFYLEDKLPKADLSFFLKQTVMYRLSGNRIIYKSLHFSVKKCELPPLDKSSFAIPKEKLTLKLKRF